MELTLLTESAALQMAGAPAFQSAWRSLHARCPWATACQHPDFVLPWYRLYGTGFLPVIVVAQSEDGGLQGLLTLAHRRDALSVTGAGERQAEYHAWLAGPDEDDRFIRAAISKVRSAFPGSELCLRYLPPGTPLGWTVEADGGNRHCVVRAHRRPLMHIDAPAMGRQRNKKNHRQNFNRLSRIGDVAFARVRDKGDFARVLDEICLQYDFRQGALHHQMPFRTDPMKKPFLLELHERGLLHVTVLTVDGKVAAAHLGLLSHGRALHLGLNTHAPGLAAHSPGQLLLAMLGVQLAEEGVPLLDLTPGGDGYKEQLATGYDLVFELTFHASARQRLQAGLRTRTVGWVKAGLRAAGYRSTDVLAAAGVLQRLRSAGARGFAARLRARRSTPPGELRCRLDTPPRHPGDAAVSRNLVADALLFGGGAADPAYWEFLHMAMQRMERSHAMYSLVRKERLVLCCWVTAGSVIRLYDLYVDTDVVNGQCLRGFLKQVVYDLQRRGGAGELACTCTLSPELRLAFEESGFVDTSPEAVPAQPACPPPRSWEPGS